MSQNDILNTIVQLLAKHDSMTAQRMIAEAAHKLENNKEEKEVELVEVGR